MTQAEQFFYDNAGYSYDPATETAEQGRERRARELARAEAYGTIHEGWEVEWADDLCGCIGCDCGDDDCACSTGVPHETLICVVRDTEGNMLASCGGICEPSREYRRVMEAELMLIEREQRNAEECGPNGGAK
jgi:hypothetical protein